MSPNRNIIPLSMAKQGSTVQVSSIAAGREFNRRLAEMGIFPSVKLAVIKNAGAGQFVVRIKDTRLVLGRGMAHKIMVTE